MGEAWFMSDARRMYPELLGDLDQVSDSVIEDALVETVQGPTCFGQSEEWTDWYHYMLPRLMRRRWKQFLYHPGELLITATMAQHPIDDERAPYAGFISDMLATLGQYIMSPLIWQDGRARPGACFDKFKRVDGTFGWWESEGLLPASLFLGLKYLPADEIARWLAEAIAIEDPFWKAQMIVWMVGAYPLLTDEVSQPSEFPREGIGAVQWNWSHALAGYYSGVSDDRASRMPFIQPDNRTAALDAIRGLSLDSFIEELGTAPDLAALASEMFDIPQRFIELYGTPQPGR